MANVITNDAHYTAIANAIRGKTGETEKYGPSQMAAKISAISTGVDTSDATAAADNIELAKTAYVNGVKVEGTLTPFTNNKSFRSNAHSAVVESPNLVLASNGLQSKVVLYPFARVELVKPLSDFGDATAADVATGKTFTSAAGLKVAGTAQTGGGGAALELVTITVPDMGSGNEGFTAIFADPDGTYEKGSYNYWRSLGIGTHKVPKNTLFIHDYLQHRSGSFTEIFNNSTRYAIMLTGDCTMYYSSSSGGGN